MNKELTLYAECFPDTHIPFDNFISDAVIGAYTNGWKIKYFDNINEVPVSKDMMVVGSVEATQEYFKRLGELSETQFCGKISPIDYRTVLGKYMGRESKISKIEDIKPPCFIKPANDIKAFTGVVLTGDPLLDTGMVPDYKGLVIEEEILDIRCEYRVYVRRGFPIGMRYYSGDIGLSLDFSLVNDCIRDSKAFNQLCYTLDFGILKTGETVLIEANDAWSIGNYGLEPERYFHFIKERWFQIIRENFKI